MAWKASGSTDLPLADRNRAWDAAEAERRVFAWAGWDDNPDPAKAAKAFFAQNTDEPELKGSYKLPFADVIDGTLTAVPRAIIAVAATLQGARGGVDLPDDVQDAIKRKVATYYSRMDMTPPWKATATREMEYKAVPTEFAAVGEQGEYEGLFAVFDNVDDGGDVIHKGAFKKTLQESGKRVKVFFAHDWMKPIGPTPDVLQETDQGLYARGHLTLRSFYGREAWELMKDGALNEGSFGFYTIQADYDEKGIRHLREVRLFEISPVPLGMNPLTDVSAIKALRRAHSAEEKLEIFAALTKALTDTDINADNLEAWRAMVDEMSGRINDFVRRQNASRVLTAAEIMERRLRMKQAQLKLLMRQS